MERLFSLNHRHKGCIPSREVESNTLYYYRNRLRMIPRIYYLQAYIFSGGFPPNQIAKNSNPDDHSYYKLQ